MNRHSLVGLLVALFGRSEAWLAGTAPAERPARSLPTPTRKYTSHEAPPPIALFDDQGSKVMRISGPLPRPIC